MLSKALLTIAITYTACMIIMMGFFASSLIDIIKGVNYEQSREEEGY